MRIAQVAPLYLSTPPKSYGGTERIISLLTEALVARGYDVTLFATGDSTTSGRLIPGAPHAMGFGQPYETTAAHVAMLARVFRHASEYDVIHTHLDCQVLPFAAMSETPTIVTMHMSLDMPGYLDALREFPDVRYVSISDSQRAPAPDLNWTATVHHGIDVAAHSYSDEPGSYLLFVGRISPEKGPERAIAIARRAGLPLKIAAKIDPKDRGYFEREIKPRLDDPLIEYLGPVEERKKCALMKDALALLLPIRWNEPFGLVFIEALACGLPVLTCPYGSAPEILRDGVTGFMAESDEELASAALRVGALSRARCRSWAERRFDVRRMAERYIEVYEAACERPARPLLDIPADLHLETPMNAQALLDSEQASSQ
jgi:glycosyltransferase involved in cell wall biosynthesis